MSQTILPTDLYIQGTLSAKSFTPPSGCITDAAVVGAANVAASKLEHQYEWNYSQANGSSVTSITIPLHTVYGATGTIVQFAAGIITPASGNDVVTVDLLKNGSSILTSVITLSVAASQNTARTMYTAAGFTSTSLVAGDWLDVVVSAVHNSGVLPQGLKVRLVQRELAQ